MGSSGWRMGVHRRPRVDTSAASTSSPSGLVPFSIHATRSSKACSRTSPIEHAVARPPHRPLHEQMGRARGNRPAPVRLLVAPRHAPVPGLVNSEHGNGYAAGQFCEGRVRAPRPRAFGRCDASDLGVELFLGDAKPGSIRYLTCKVLACRATSRTSGAPVPAM